MAKLTGFRRLRVGHRNYRADIQAPPAALDNFGQVDYSQGWTTKVSQWYCELISAAGGFDNWGEMVSSTTDSVIVGDYDHAKTATPEDRVLIDGKYYTIVAVRDVSGDKRELRIELKTGHSTIA